MSFEGLKWDKGARTDECDPSLDLTVSESATGPLVSDDIALLIKTYHGRCHPLEQSSWLYHPVPYDTDQLRNLSTSIMSLTWPGLTDSSLTIAPVEQTERSTGTIVISLIALPLVHLHSSGLSQRQRQLDLRIALHVEG